MARRDPIFLTADVVYSPVNPITYSVADLRRHSWAFFFNQSGAANPIDSVGSLVHSYNRNDFALWAQICDDYFLRNYHDHYNRPNPPGDRLACEFSTDLDGNLVSRNLAHQVPALLRTTARIPDYEIHDIEPVAGQQPIDLATVLINARNFGFRLHSHNGHKGGNDRDISALLGMGSPSIWDALFGLQAEPILETPLPRIWHWFEKLISSGSYKKGVE